MGEGSSFDGSKYYYLYCLEILQHTVKRRTYSHSTDIEGIAREKNNKRREVTIFGGNQLLLLTLQEATISAN